MSRRITIVLDDDLVKKLHEIQSKQIKESKEYRSLVPPEVFKYIDEMNFYRK